MFHTTNAPAEGAVLEPIRVPYLLVLFPVGFVRDEAGRLFIDPLWAKDLAEHTRYLKDLTLISYELPSSRRTPEWVAVDSQPALREVRCVTVPRPRSFVHALAMLPRTWWTVWREARRCVVVHSGFSWPIGEAWLLASMQWLHRNFQVIMIESAAWRVAPGTRAGRLKRIQAAFYERVNRYFANRVDLALFTQPEYRDTLRTRRREAAHVIEASWIDAEWVIGESECRARTLTLAQQGALRLMFAGRLTPEKGIDWLLPVLAQAAREGLPVELDIYGEGPLADALRSAIQTHGLSAVVSMRGKLAYGAPFLAALREHHVLIVPSLSDEQPRVVYDAYSQAVPVLASATPGLTQCVADGRTGWLFPSGNEKALLERLRHLVGERQEIARAAQAAVEVARTRTHRAMHGRRWALLQQALVG